MANFDSERFELIISATADALSFIRQQIAEFVALDPNHLEKGIRGLELQEDLRAFDWLAPYVASIPRNIDLWQKQPPSRLRQIKRNSC